SKNQPFGWFFCFCPLKRNGQTFIPFCQEAIFYGQTLVFPFLSHQANVYNNLFCRIWKFLSRDGQHV
ncbi:hypothetical protein, partial [Alteromonas sp. KUL150]|uniref:hypothetical protein n=1 Tax=Alteromonas sp. KUL150 TaxID=2480805 RepID=UPI001F1B7AD1